MDDAAESPRAWFVISLHAVCLIWVNEILLSFVFVEVLKDFVPCRCDIGQIRLKPECSFMSKNGRAEIRCNGRAHRKSRCATSPQGVVLLALRINVSLESRKTQGTLPFSQPISQPFILLSFVLILCVSLMLSCVIIFKIISTNLFIEWISVEVPRDFAPCHAR